MTTEQTTSEPRRPFRAGDHVLHRPSGETWVIACDEQGGHIICCGWPESHGHFSECELVKAATDEERIDLLRRVAASGGSGRGSRARAQLKAIDDANQLANIRDHRAQFAEHLQKAVDKFDCDKAAQVFALYGWTWQRERAPTADDIRAHLASRAADVVERVMETGASAFSRTARITVALEWGGSSWDAHVSLSIEAEEYGDSWSLPYPVGFEEKAGT